ncbi:MAG: hypothetical protein FWC66_05080 [Oscillospiraceae bacterium]|nr:hypothetical protein [Oscillospiraceae bacterium]
MMDKSLETGLLIGAGLGLALSPVIKKIATGLPQIERVTEDEHVKHLPEHDDHERVRHDAASEEDVQRDLKFYEEYHKDES